MSSNNKITTHTCKICKNDKGNIQYLAKEMMFGFKDEFIYFECKACHCLQIEKFPNDMSKYYPDDYYSFSEYNPEKFNGLAGYIRKKQYSWEIPDGKSYKRTLAFLFAGKHFRLINGVSVNKETKILDIGCGNGSLFLYPLAEIGFKNLLGSDPFLKVPRIYPNGLHIKNSQVFDILGKWDIITYHHSFEHIENPLQNLKKVSELLSENGVCILRVPTVPSYAWEHYRTNWVQLDAPRHFFLHSKRSMEILAKKSGLELFKTVYDSTTFQFIESERYVNNISFLSPEPKGVINCVKKKIKKYQYKKFAKKLNNEGKGDQAAFYFRKRGNRN